MTHLFGLGEATVRFPVEEVLFEVLGCAACVRYVLAEPRGQQFLDHAVVNIPEVYTP